MLGRLPWIAAFVAVMLASAVHAAERTALLTPLNAQPAVLKIVARAALSADAAVPGEDLLIAIGDWLSSRYGMPPLARTPRVALATSRQLATRHFGDFTAAGRTGRADILAVYEDRESTIYLSAGLSVPDPAALSVIVHEMVHHMQNEAGMKYACAEEREQQAFAAQADWLAMFGTDLATEFGIDPLTLLVRTKCFY